MDEYEEADQKETIEYLEKQVTNLLNTVQGLLDVLSSIESLEPHLMKQVSDLQTDFLEEQKP